MIQVYSAVTWDRDKRKDNVLCFSEYNRFISPRLNAKIYKILPHLFLDTEYSIWVDGNVTLNVEPEVLVEMMGGKDIGVFRNPYRNCLYAEAKVCKETGLDDSETIDEQTRRYKKIGYPRLNGLGACYLIVRRHTDEIKRLNEQWWAEITRGSVRDQISFPYVFNGEVQYFPPQPNRNKYFTRIGHK